MSIRTNMCIRVYLAFGLLPLFLPRRCWYSYAGCNWFRVKKWKKNGSKSSRAHQNA